VSVFPSSVGWCLIFPVVHTVQSSGGGSVTSLFKRSHDARDEVARLEVCLVDKLGFQLVRMFSRPSAGLGLMVWLVFGAA
jgi:hypothetical protein